LNIRQSVVFNERKEYMAITDATVATDRSGLTAASLNFDVAAAISQDEITSASQELYKVLYPRIFTGDFPYTDNNLNINLTVHWDVQSAPVIDLTPSPAARIALVNLLTAMESVGTNAGFSIHNLRNSIVDMIPNFSTHLPKVVLTIKTPGERDASLTLDLTAYCYAQYANGKISLYPTQIIAAQQADPLYDILVQKLLVPEIKKLLTDHLTNLTLPAIKIEGIELSAAAIAIENGHLVASANLAAKGTPPSPAGTLWTNSGLTVLLGQDALQTAVALGISRVSGLFRDSGSQESLGFGYYWSYSGSFGTPQVQLHPNDAEIDITLPINMKVEAGAIAFGQHIGVAFNAITKPDPTVTCSFAASGQQVQITIEKLNNFVVLVEPTGSIPQEVLGWMITGIVNAITVSASAILSAAIMKFKLPPITLPTFKPTIDNITFAITPQSVMITKLNDMIAVGGHMEISS
jgi:hypothetical protein